MSCNLCKNIVISDNAHICQECGKMIKRINIGTIVEIGNRNSYNYNVGKVVKIDEHFVRVKWFLFERYRWEYVKDLSVLSNTRIRKSI